MSKINYQISTQKFEQVLDKICFILADEISAQSQTQHDLFDEVKVWKERFIAFDKTELPAINVYFEGQNFSENTPITSKAITNIGIEVIVSDKHSDVERADVKSALKCHKLLGVIRFILKNPNYLRLGFNISDNFIFNTNVANIQMSTPIKKDALHIISGKIDFEVQLEEYNGEIQPIPVQIYNSKIKLNQTDKGFLITKIN